MLTYSQSDFASQLRLSSENGMLYTKLRKGHDRYTGCSADYAIPDDQVPPLSKVRTGAMEQMKQLHISKASKLHTE